ncbi:uncharacterized protein MYCFIDRAFT_179337 [Pseudocercospora fijiensis CIRAD86]|uniref:Uncharacterized protein n=1 Tax=Pseudocercospora fijiensis (strain CIRAD86) TaxID=383855 RepID=M3A0D0_PSEFD|nr:uncharacterized protein MYCFIDRAFT_179337 [Pseudocercospora fijiensis CIRAD86]EME77861.1 hypothetical protein MYCFIDRAFT_179337 [Pseudocercospora fijiensis CIRAD86]
MTASGAGIQPGGAELGALFGFGGYGAHVFDPARDLKWRPPGREKVKKEEHWMFPKMAKRKNVFEHISDVPKPSVNPVDESKKSFESLLGSKQHMKVIEQDGLHSILEFLQSSKDEPKAHNIKRLSKWLVSKSLKNVTIRPLTEVVLEKIRLGTMDEKELPDVLAAILMSGSHESPALRVLDALSREALQATCARTTQILFKYTFAGLVRVKQLPEQIEMWLCDLRKCRHLQVYHSEDPIWESVYEVLASRTSSPAAAASHLYHLKRLELCLVLLRFWAPYFASTAQERTMQFTTLGSQKRLTFVRPKTASSDLIAAFNERRPTTRRGRLSSKSPFVSMLSVLQDHGIPHAEFAHNLFTILTAKAERGNHGALVVYLTFRKLQQHPTLGVPAGLANRLIRHFLKCDSARSTAFAHKIFLQIPSLPLSTCYSLPLQLARRCNIPSSTIWDILGRQTADDVVWKREDRICNEKNRLSQPHIDLVHLVAHEYAKSSHLRPRVAFRRVWECYRFLQDRGAPLAPLLTRAMVISGVLRPLKGFKRPSTTQFQYILSLVRRIEGEEVAMKLDRAVWTLWQSRTLPRIRLRRQLRADIHSALPSIDAHDQKASAMYRLKRWSMARRERYWTLRSSKSEDACGQDQVQFTPVQSMAELASSTVSATMPANPKTRISRARESFIGETEALTDDSGPTSGADSILLGDGTNSWTVKQSIMPQQHDQSSSSSASITVARIGLGYTTADVSSSDAAPVRAAERFNRAIKKKVKSDDHPPCDCDAQTSTIANFKLVEGLPPVSSEPQERSSTSSQDAIDAHAHAEATLLATTSDEPTLFRKFHRTYDDNGARELVVTQPIRQGVPPNNRRHSALKNSAIPVAAPIPRKELIRMAKAADGVVVSPTGRVFVLWREDNGAESLMHYQSARKRAYAEKARAEAQNRDLSEHQQQLLVLVDRGREKMDRVMQSQAEEARANTGMASGEGEFAWNHFKLWSAEREAKESDKKRPSRESGRKALIKRRPLVMSLPCRSDAPSPPSPVRPPPECKSAPTSSATMADIQQWRRRIQPTRSRTPYTPHEPDESDDYFSPTTPKRKLKPKLSSYFGHNQKSSLQGAFGPIGAELPSWPLEQLYPDPKAEQMIDSVMSRVMADPYAPLDVQHNSSLMAIFEEYLSLRDEKVQLQRQLEAELDSAQDLIAKFNAAEHDWIEERNDYREEVKRLEVLLAKNSKRGVAEVTLARQDSKLRTRSSRVGSQKETVFEFLEKTKCFEDAAWSGQRADAKIAMMKAPILQSPSDKDKRMSLRLAPKKSTTNIHADLPFGTPPVDTRFSLTNASELEKQARRQGRKRAVTSSTISTSDDTFSTFSCEGVSLPDETITFGPPRSANADDFSSIEQIAYAVARRRNVDPSNVLPQLLDMFDANGEAGRRNASMPVNFDLASPKPAGSAKWPERSSSKQKTVMSKASGFFHRLKPQLTVDTLAASFPAPTRRFSFEPGDDSRAVQDDTDASRRQHDLPQAVKDRILKKSVSLAALNEQAAKTAALDRSVSPTMQQPLSPVAQSPPASAPGSASLPPTDGRPPSRIPTPVFNSKARPRQEREDSASSLLTAIKVADGSNRSNSITSSTCNSPPGSIADPARASYPASAGGFPPAVWRTSSSKNLLEHTNILRTGSRNATPARSASAANEVSFESKVHGQQTSVRNQPGCSQLSEILLASKQAGEVHLYAPACRRRWHDLPAERCQSTLSTTKGAPVMVLANVRFVMGSSLVESVGSSLCHSAAERKAAVGLPPLCIRQHGPGCPALSHCSQANRDTPHSQDVHEALQEVPTSHVVSNGGNSLIGSSHNSADADGVRERAVLAARQPSVFIDMGVVGMGRDHTFQARFKCFDTGTDNGTWRVTSTASQAHYSCTGSFAQRLADGFDRHSLAVGMKELFQTVGSSSGWDRVFARQLNRRNANSGLERPVGSDDAHGVAGASLMDIVGQAMVRQSVHRLPVRRLTARPRQLGVRSSAQNQTGRKRNKPPRHIVAQGSARACGGDHYHEIQRMNASDSAIQYLLSLRISDAYRLEE